MGLDKGHGNPCCTGACCTSIGKAIVREDQLLSEGRKLLRDGEKIEFAFQPTFFSPLFNAFGF